MIFYVINLLKRQFFIYHRERIIKRHLYEKLLNQMLRKILEGDVTYSKEEFINLSGITGEIEYD